MFLCAVLVLCGGCRRKDAAVTVILRPAGALFSQPLRAGIDAALQGSRVRVRWEPPSDSADTEDQLKALETAAERHEGIVVDPAETLALRSVVLRAVAQKTPVVVVDDDFGPIPGPFLSYVSSDEAAGARLAAERLARQLHGHGTVAVVGISPRLEGSITREVLFERAVHEVAPGLRFVLRQWGDAAVTHEQQVCQALLNSSSPPDAIVTLSAVATRGALYAKLARNEPSRAIIIGFDQDDSSMLAAVFARQIDAVVVQDTRALGERAARNLLAEREGRSFPAHTVVPPLLATRETLMAPEIPAALGFSSGLPAFAHSPLPSFDQSMAFFRLEAKRHELQPGVEPIGDFIRQPGVHPGITVQGTVVSLPPMLEVQDETSAVFVPSYRSSQPLKLGDVVTVQGDLTSERFRSQIERALVNVLWSGPPIAPLAVTAMQLTANYRGQSIEVEGTVLSQGTANGRPELLLQDGSQTFRALIYGQHAQPAKFARGSRVRLRGTAAAMPDLTQDIYPFTVIADSVELLRAAPWWSPLHIALLTCTVALLLFGLQWLLHRVQRWHLRSVLREREQLAFEMHDTLAQSFTGIAYQLHAARSEKRGREAVEERIEHALEMVKMSHREASRTIASLRPQQRDAPGILYALKQSAERLSASGPLSVHTSLAGGSSQLPLEVTEAFFRIGQEAISNAIQHGHCTTLSIELFASRRLACLTVRDDGVGFVACTGNSGLGITGMKRRTEAIRARFSVLSVPGQGTTVTVRCPLIFASGLISYLRAKLTAGIRVKHAS